MPGEQTETSALLEAAAQACAGEGGCSGCVEDAPCCMTETARRVFAAIEAAGGPSLEEIEAIASGEYVVAQVIQPKKA